ncbi:MAG TPA: hypothetical protein VGF75_06685 [Candidatus Saccharimonadales bacterium]
MSVLIDTEAKLAAVKNKVEGDLKVLITKLEAVFQHVSQAPLEDVVKEAVATNLHDAATKVEAIADTVRSDVDVVDKAVDTADSVVDKTATK